VGVADSSHCTADLIVECLENEGVTHVFGIPGEENIQLVEAISRSSIRYMLARHEQGASFMAEAYGRLTGRAGVCSATLGPGAINLLLGTADATTNSTPLIALSAQVGMSRSFKESHQGVDLVSARRGAAAVGARACGAGRARGGPSGRGPGPAPVRRDAGHPGGDHVSRQGRVPR
jgi:thiamine pyrophosphate-dependent acetolactate synthase large subunit-like protein